MDDLQSNEFLTLRGWSTFLKEELPALTTAVLSILGTNLVN
jgi:hypothetical protein